MASRALVIGPGRYAPDSGIASHPTIGVSASEYGEVLAADELWGPDCCRVLGEDEVETVDAVMRALQEAADVTEPEDTLLVVYIGHGQYWSDLPGSQVHFAVGSSYRNNPWTWLSSWYVYRVMRKARARLKVLIADCCYSNLLSQLGAEQALPGVLGERHEGTCVFTAVKEVASASAEGCRGLPGALARCTPFSGHLLHVLREGTRDYNRRLTIGLLREAVTHEMDRCHGSPHQVPRMLLNDAREATPLFTNRMEATRRDRGPQVPGDPDGWIRKLMVDKEFQLDMLLADPRTAGNVVARLRAGAGEESRLLADHIDRRANEAFGSPQVFARYWNQVERALRT